MYTQSKDAVPNPSAYLPHTTNSVSAPPLARSVSGSGVGEAILLSNPSGEAILLSSLCGQRGKPALKLVMQTCYHLTGKTTARQSCSQAGDANLLPLFLARCVNTHMPRLGGNNLLSTSLQEATTCSQPYVKVGQQVFVVGYVVIVVCCLSFYS